MAADSIGYPLPVLVNGYACLNTDEIDLAKKNVDPGNPTPDPAPPRQTPYDPVRAADARMAAQSSAERIVAYSPAAVKTGVMPTGTVMSLNA